MKIIPYTVVIIGILITAPLWMLAALYNDRQERCWKNRIVGK